MSKRPSPAVYIRRRLVALLVIVIPVALLVRACTSAPAAEPARTPPRPSLTDTATDTVTVNGETTTASALETVTEQPSAKPTIGDCTAADIEVSVTTDATSYSIGMPISITMRIANISGNACRRDVGALSNEISVTDPNGALVWSSDACQDVAKPQIALMQAGAVFGNTQRWDGRNSGRVCESDVADTVPGEYLAYARNDTVISKPVRFSITLD